MVMTRREATRAATVQEIKDAALALMRAQGTVDVKLSDVAREMRMSAPGLYRYFDGREALLTALIVDSLTALAERVEAARDAVPADDPGGRFLAVCRTYRAWATEDREGFTLVFGPAIAGLDRLHQAPTPEGAPPPDKAAILRALEALRSLTRDADERGVRCPLPITALPTAMAETLCGDKGDDAATELAMIYCWASLHGFITLEVNGNLSWHEPALLEPMFLGLVRVQARLLGLPDPAAGWPEGTPTP